MWPCLTLILSVISPSPARLQRIIKMRSFVSGYTAADKKENDGIKSGWQNIVCIIARHKLTATTNHGSANACRDAGTAAWVVLCIIAAT
jgi:hypothetical protein